MTITPSLVGCRPGRPRSQPRSRDDGSFHSQTDQDEIDTRNEISQELAKESIPRFVSPEESAVAPQKLNSGQRAAMPCRVLHIFSGTLSSNNEVIPVTRNACGDTRRDNPASLSRGEPEEPDIQSPE
jgi:hypothetical protein